MQGNDISNESPKRILVTDSVVSEQVIEPKKFLGVVVKAQSKRVLNQQALASLWRVANSLGARLELDVLDADQDEADALFDLIEARGTQPFNYARAYESVHEFVSELPYRPEVLGVIDTPERAARYGSMAISMEQLSRVI